jgi:muramoyltetrapeptide carboxypeptidase
MQPVFPPALNPGDTIGVVAPSGVVNRKRVERAISRLQQVGFQVKTYGDLYRSRGYLAGDDQTRVSELMSAFTDPVVRAIFPARGGYGIARLLHRLDYDQIRRQPKIVTGFSDITALHLALQRHCNLVTFHSPNLMDGLGAVKGLGTLAEQSYWRALRADNYQATSEQNALPGKSSGHTGYALLGSDSTGMLEMGVVLETVQTGQAEGRIVGGNLALIASTLGTPYEIDTTDRLLFLEDIGEPPYRIDRYLSQLRLAGKLDPLTGVILGHFTNCQPTEREKSLSLDEVMADYLAPLNVPVVRNFPAGHEMPNLTLPLGVLARLDADKGSLELLENPVTL